MRNSLVNNNFRRYPVPRRLRFLLVDDHDAAAQTSADLLWLYGHDVRIASDGQSALEMAAEYLPDVVVTELRYLPRINGYDLVQRLRTLSGLERVRIVALTTCGSPEDRRRCRELKLLHVLKPCDPAKAMRVIDRWLARRGSGQPN